MDDCDQIIGRFKLGLPENAAEYFETHRRRYGETLSAMLKYKITGERALEVGTSWIFCDLALEFLGFKACDVTIYDPRLTEKIILTGGRDVLGPPRTFTAFNLDIQTEPYPVSDATYDLVILLEVLEHIPTDPVFVMGEINRVLKPDGCVFITTPNITATQRVRSILQGWHPHFFCVFNRQGTSDRHNLEYSPQLLTTLMEASGFDIVRLWTRDVWDEPDQDVLRLLRQRGYPTELRGDDLFCIARKGGAMRERYPALLYF